MTNPPIVFIDTETTGLHADRRPWEIAMIRRESDGSGSPLQSEITLQVADVDLASAELIGLNVGRFYQRHHQFMPFDPGVGFAPVAEGDPFMLAGPVTAYIGSEAEVAVAVEQWTRGAHIVGAVPNFDTETLAAMLRRHGLCPSWHYHLIDVEALAYGWLHGVAAHGHSSLACADSPVDCNRWGEMAEGVSDEDCDLTRLPFRSDNLSRACGVEPPSKDERHTAMGDARWAMRLFDRITGAVEGEAL